MGENSKVKSTEEETGYITNIWDYLQLLGDLLKTHLASWRRGSQKGSKVRKWKSFYDQEKE